MQHLIKLLRHTATAIFLPHYCLLCRLTETQLGLCTSCIRDLPWQEIVCPLCAQPMTENILCADCLQQDIFYDQIIAPLRYEYTIRYLISQFKFHERLVCANLLSDLFIQHINNRTHFIKPDLLIPVPLHTSRLRERGFNQALEMSKRFARILNIPLQRSLLYKKQASAAQSSLDFKSRKKNIKNRFELKHAVTGKHIAIVDDVVTTGSTANEIAKLLKQNGATRVSVWAIARTVLGKI